MGVGAVLNVALAALQPHGRTARRDLKRVAADIRASVHHRLVVSAPGAPESLLFLVRPSVEVRFGLIDRHHVFHLRSPDWSGLSTESFRA